MRVTIKQRARASIRLKAISYSAATKAGQGDAEGGTDNQRYMTALGTKQQIGARLADEATAIAGINATELLTPETGKASILANAKDGEFTPDGSDAVSRTLEARAQESLMSARDFGAVGDGVTDDSPALAKLVTEASALGRTAYLPAMSYKLDTDVVFPTGSGSVKVDTGAVFSGPGLFKLDGLMPLQETPSTSHDVVRKDFSSFDMSNFQNQFLLARQATSTAAGNNVVAVMGQGSSGAAGSGAFGGNFLGQVIADGGTAIGCEIDCGVRSPATTGNAYGLVLATAGVAQPRAAIQVQAHTASSKFIDGMIYAFDGTAGCVSGALWKAVGISAAAGSCQRFIYVSPEISATVAEIDVPSLFVGPTNPALANRLSIVGASTGGGPTLSAIGSDANISMAFTAKGTGIFAFNANGSEVFRIASTAGTDRLQVSAGNATTTINAIGSSTNITVNIQGKGSGLAALRDSTGLTKFGVNTGGIGFFGTTTAPQKTMAAATGTATRTTFDTATVTTQQLAERVKALIDDLRGWGLHA
jgi:hypothetical protein